MAIKSYWGSRQLVRFWTSIVDTTQVIKNWMLALTAISCLYEAASNKAVAFYSPNKMGVWSILSTLLWLFLAASTILSKKIMLNILIKCCEIKCEAILERTLLFSLNRLLLGLQIGPRLQAGIIKCHKKSCVKCWSARKWKNLQESWFPQDSHPTLTGVKEQQPNWTSLVNLYWPLKFLCGNT